MRTVNIGGEIRTALNKLGTSSNEIAQSLANKGIKAFCGLPSACALAEYLHEQFPGYIFEVHARDIHWAPIDVGFKGHGKSQTVDLTPTEMMFVFQFDTHVFPELEKYDRG